MDKRWLIAERRINISLLVAALFSACKSKATLMNGFVLYKRSKNEEAIEALNKAIEADPHNVAAWKFKGVILSKFLRRYIESLDTLNRSLRINPQDKDAWNLKGIILARYLHKYEEAIEAFDRSILLDPNDPDVWNYRFDALMAKNSLSNSKFFVDSRE